LTTFEEDNYQIQYAHGMGLISDELYAVLYIVVVVKAYEHCIFLLITMMMCLNLNLKSDAIMLDGLPLYLCSHCREIVKESILM